MKIKSRTWVVLRGLAREKGHWGPFADQLSARFSNDEVLFIDLPGAGEFRDVACPRSMAEIFQFVRAQAIERARAQSHFTLLTISLGGMVALEWLRQRPEDLSGAIMINTSSSQLSPFYHRLRWQIWPKFLKAAANQVPREREKQLTEFLINSSAARERAVPLWTRLAVDRPLRYPNFLNQIYAAARFKDLPGQDGKVPVLLLSGLGDRLVDPSCSRQLHEHFGWPLKVHAWGGHDLTWDDPEWVLKQIDEWLQAAKPID